MRVLNHLAETATATRSILPPDVDVSAGHTD